MAVVESTYVVAQRGTGRPDYSEHVYEIKRGETYSQFGDRLNEHTKIFLYAAVVGHELAVGATVFLFDFETFMDANPYTSPAGWLCDFREWMLSFNGLVRMDIGCGDFPGLVLTIRAGDRDLSHEYEELIFFDTKYWDPTAAAPHNWTFSLTNEDSIPLTGAVQVAMVLTNLGTEVPTEKKVKHLECGHINTVPLEQTKITCEECKETFFVPYYGRGII